MKKLAIFVGGVATGVAAAIGVPKLVAKAYETEKGKKFIDSCVEKYNEITGKKDEVDPDFEDPTQVPAEEAKTE